MEIKKYLTTIIEPWSDPNWKPWEKENWPKPLVLPDDMVIKFRKLYEMGKKAGVEMGYSMKFDLEKQTIAYGKVIKGAKHSCPLPAFHGDEAFGNVHCHPGGAAHSAADIAGFRDHTKKPIFIQFVVAAPDRIYAVIHRFRKSKFSRINTNHMMKDTKDKLEDFFERNCPIQAKQRFEVMYGKDYTGGLLNLRQDSHLRKTYSNVHLKEGETLPFYLVERYQELCRKMTPGYANYDRALSEKNMVGLKAHGFGFFESHESTAGRLACV